MVLCPDERSFSQLAFKRNTGHRIKKKKKKIKSRIWNEFTKQFAQRNEYISEKNQRHVFFFDLATKDFYVLFMLLLLKKLGQIWTRWLFDWQNFLLKKYRGKWQISRLGSKRFKLNLNDLKKLTKSFIGAYYLNFSYKS